MERLILAASFFLGCFAILAQTILFREQLAILEGNELTLGLLLAGWLIGVAVGALTPRKLDVERSLSRWFAAILLSPPLMLAVCVILIRLLPAILDVPVGEIPSPIQTLLFALMAALPLGFLFGFSFPVFSAALNQCQPAESGEAPIAKTASIGSIFLIESLGGAMAGFLMAIGRSQLINPFLHSVIALGVFGLILILSDDRLRRKSILLSAIIAIPLLLYLSQILNDWSASRRWENHHPGYELYRCLETPYQRLEIGGREGQYTLFGNGAELFSFPNEYEAPQWAYMALSQNPQAKSILLASGDSGLLAPLAEHRPDKIAVAYLDSGIGDIFYDGLGQNIKRTVVKNFPLDFNRSAGPLPGVALSIDQTDIRRLLSSIPQQTKFDCIIIIQPGPSNGLLNRLYTREFFRHSRDFLSSDGVFVITAAGPPAYDYGDAGANCGAIYWTLREVFPNVLAVPGVTWWFFASPSRQFLIDADAIAQRHRELNLDSAYFAPEFFSLFYEAERIRQAEKSLQTYAAMPRNTDDRPLCYLYHLLIWSKQYNYLKWLPVEALAKSGASLLGIGLAAALLFYGVCYGASRMILGRKRNPAPLVTLAATGLASMGAEISILLFFQSKVGCLYERVGVFFAIFMLGLALGAVFAKRRGMASKPASIALLGLDRGLFLILLITPIMLMRVESLNRYSIFEFAIQPPEMALWLWNGIIAFAAGMIFTITAQAMPKSESVSSSAGWVDAADNLGGALGALVTGVLLVPILGIMNTFYLFAGVKAMNLIGLYLWTRKIKLTV
ncbi:MAG: hypothetical protein AB1656_02920 [Candidatus Omnitrophota bacterium]